MPTWFETMEDRFWLQPDDVGGEEARFILGALGLRRGDAVLDAPCGAGRVSLQLARAGCVITGIDLRDSFIRRARRRFRAVGMRGTFRMVDLRNTGTAQIAAKICCKGGAPGLSKASEPGLGFG